MISVIVPNYNHLKFLPERLDSIFNQTFQEFEVILLDDCSSDGSWEYLKSFEDHPKVTYCIRNEVNSGSPFAQWKRGLDLAKFEWIWIAESDDFSDLNFLEEACSQINQKTIAVFCNSLIVDNNSNLIGNFQNSNKWVFPDKILEEREQVFNGKLFVKKFLIYQNIIGNASSIIFKKPKIKIDQLDKFKYCGDWFFWIMLFESGKINFISKELNFFRSHDNSTRSKKDIEDEKIKLLEIFLILKISRKKLNPFLWIKRDILICRNLVLYYFKNFNSCFLKSSMDEFPLIFRIIFIYYNLRVK